MADKENKKDIPVWGVIVLITTILIGCVGWSWGAVQSQAVSKVNDLANRIEAIEARVRASELNQSAMVKDIEYIKQDVSEILKILKGK